MTWESLTKQFNSDEIKRIETTPVVLLKEAILASDPVVALRILAELFLHNDSRLDELLRNTVINLHWVMFIFSLGVDQNDLLYASDIAARIPTAVEEPRTGSDPQRKYPKDDPHWVQATLVKESGVVGYVYVYVLDKDYGIQRVGWSNPHMDKTKSDCSVEDPEMGWLKIWWNNSDVKPQ